MVRELGLKRRETVLSLSATNVENCKDYVLVREDRIKQTSCVSVVLSKAAPSSYVCKR